MYDDRAGRTPLTAKRFRPGIFEPASGSQRKNFPTKLLGTGWGEVALPEHHKKEFYNKKELTTQALSKKRILIKLLSAAQCTTM